MITEYDFNLYGRHLSSLRDYEARYLELLHCRKLRSQHWGKV